ncbi:MAG: pyridoxal phosphate-dependent aminotransferase [Armatimonadetes bacterium]|nr:pyridoxal phosphate-dependent aminotransferase [Armatimonadota bacterium]
MRFDFDRIIDRTGTGSLKWDRLDARFGATGILPLWVADMDFESPPEVVAALVRRAQHGVYGYTTPMPEYYQAVTDWFARRHFWRIAPEWIVTATGIVPALNLLIQTFTKPGEGVIVQKPVYHPFMSAIERNGRRVVNNPLRSEGNVYRMDYADLERKAAEPGTRLLILCSPHNPVGRLWTAEELERVGDICFAHDILVISDEIHCDLVYEGRRHVPFGSLSEEFLLRSITCTAPSKTFNLAGLQAANLVIASPELRDRYRRTIACLGLGAPNLFGIEALIAAYRHGEEWLDELMAHLAGNLAFLKEFIAANVPRVKVVEPEATYLVWLDFRDYGLDAEALQRLVRERARLALVEGHLFGSPEGDGFERVNIACPRATLEDALKRMQDALASV